MPVLAAAVAVVAAICLLNLLLTFGVIRRLRDHERRLAEGVQPLRHRLEPGAAIGPFTATATDGQTVSAGTLPPQTVVGFFSPGCKPCLEQLPRFIEFAADLPGGREQVLAVVCGPAEDAGPLAERLEPVARVVLEENGGELAGAFGTLAFPSVFVTDGEGTVQASGGTVDQLRLTAAVGSAR
jgi:thiol-disulfide isomerase/thioredoxin